MPSRALWTLLIFVSIGPALGGVALVAQTTLLDLLSGRGAPSLDSIARMVPYFWSFAWVQALLIGVLMLLLSSVIRTRANRLLLTIPVGFTVMLLVTPLIYGQPLQGYVSEPFAWVLAIASGIATLPSQLIVETILARMAADA